VPVRFLSNNGVATAPNGRLVAHRRFGYAALPQPAGRVVHRRDDVAMKIVICDDHALFRAGLRLVLRELEGSPELLEASGAEETLRLVEAHPDLDLLLMDLEMPGMNGLEALDTLRARVPAIPVVIVSASERQADVRDALDRGAAGFIPKSSSAPVLLAALRLILSGGVYVPPLVLAATATEPPRPAAMDRRGDRVAGLTPRQLEVLELMAAGRTNREICDALGIAEGTVKAHVATVLETLGVANRTEAGAVLRGRGADTGRRAPPEPPSPAAATPSEGVFRQEGDFWTIEYGGAVCYLRDSKGLHYVAALLRQPGREWPASALVGDDPADGTDVERVRQNVARAVRTALERLGERNPALASHLQRTITIGATCCYASDPRTPVRWRL
jgi:DNA-binding NarL/FixJ family response regulator